MFTFSGAIAQSSNSGALMPARNQIVTFVDIDDEPVTFEGGVTSVRTDSQGRFSGLQHAGISQIKPVINGAISQDIISAPFDVAAAAIAAEEAAASAAASAALVGAPAGNAIDAHINGGTSPAVKKGDLLVNVLNHGVVGDGVTLDHVAINAAIDAGAGRTVYFPAPLGAKTYLIDATAGIKLDQPGTKLLLDRGAKIKVQANGADAYMAVEVTAADCAIEGGTIEGDVGTHTGSTGEWGHLIVAQAGAHRLRVQGVTVTKAWGDGIAIQNNPADVSILDVIADDNRRQGLSIIHATRPRVIGGVYKNTGLTANTAPSAGIDVEPNSATTVTDCLISGVIFSGNRGPGLQIATASGSSAEVNVTGCRSIGSTTSAGVYLVGPAGTIKAKITGMLSVANALHGFMVNATGVQLDACTARSNTQYGFQINSSDAILTNPVAKENGRVGLQISGAAVANTIVNGGVLQANSQTTNGTYVNFDNWGTDTVAMNVISDAGTLANKPAYGFLTRAGSSGRFIDCDTKGTFTVAGWSDGSSAGATLASPVPGRAAPTNIFNVRAFGAKGDGVTNDTAAITATVTAAGVGGNIHFPPGNYILAGQMTLLAGQTVSGDSGATVTQTNNLQPVIQIHNVAGCRVRGIKFVGKTTDYVNTSAVYGAGAVRITGTSSDVIVSDCTFLSFAGLGVYMASTTTDIIVARNRMTGPGATYILNTTYNYSGGIVVDPGCLRWAAFFNDISQFAQGIVTGDNMADVRIIGNLIHDIPGQHGMYLETMTSGVVSNNIIRNTGLCGMKIQVGTTGATDPTDIVVSGNSIRSAGAQGILLDNPVGGAPRFRQITISDNTIKSVSGPGIEVKFSIGIKVTDNVITTVTVGAGIRVASCSELDVINNRITTVAAMGIDVTATQNYELRGNRIINPGTANGATTEFGIGIDGATTAEGVIEDNRITDSLGNMRYGIAAHGINAAPDLATHTFRRNYVTGATDYGYRGVAAAIREFDGNDFNGTTGRTLNAPTSGAGRGPAPIGFGTAAPTSGARVVGEKVYNTAPAAGGWEGWICTVAGSPGTWKGFGAIQA